MKLAIIKNGIVDSIIMAAPEFDPAGIPLSEDSLTKLGDSWDGSTFTAPPQETPPPAVQEYRTEFTSKEFMENLITDDEFDLMVSSTNATVKRIVKRFSMRNKNINVADPQYAGFLDNALADGVIADQARLDELLLGIPSA